MSDSPLLIHIGYPKTASSWLQADIFANHSTGFCVPWVNQQGLCHAASDLFINIKTFIKDTVGDYYQESNQKTSQLIGIDLAKLGYPE